MEMDVTLIATPRWEDEQPKKFHINTQIDLHIQNIGGNNIIHM
jgi:hypothetical protein